MKLRLILILALLGPLTAELRAQGAGYHDTAWKFSPSGSFPASGVTITVCLSTSSGIPCAPVTTVYLDKALTQPCLPSTIGCLIADSKGNFSFFVAPGDYIYTVTGTGITGYGPVPFSLGSVRLGTVVTIDGTAITTWQQALAALPAGGGTIDARVMPPGSSLNLGLIDPGAKRVTTLLGCNAYTFTQIVVRSGLRILGNGDGNLVCSNLTFSSTTVGDSSIFEPQTTDTVDVLLSDFSISFNGTASQNGITIQTNGASHNSAQYHHYQRLTFFRFTGVGANLDASLATVNLGEGSQWIVVFDHNKFYSCNGTSGFQAKGSVFFASFTNNLVEEVCSASGAGIGVNIVSTSAGVFPENITIGHNLIGDFTQIAEVDGGQNIVFDSNEYFFNLAGSMTGINMQVGAGTVHSTIVVNANNFKSLVGTGGGGYLVKTNDALSTLTFSNNNLQVAPTAVLSGFTTNAISFGNSGGGLNVGQIAGPGIVFANLGTPLNGNIFYCTDCTIANPCAGGGTGALAKRLNGVWVCN